MTSHYTIQMWWLVNTGIQTFEVVVVLMFFFKNKKIKIKIKKLGHHLMSLSLQVCISY